MKRASQRKRIKALNEKKFENEKTEILEKELVPFDETGMIITDEEEEKEEADKIPNPTKFNEGAWTETEEAALLKALMTHKWNEHSAISKIISTRSIAQIGKKLYSLARKPKIFKETSARKIQLRQKATQVSIQISMIFLFHIFSCIFSCGQSTMMRKTEIRMNQILMQSKCSQS